MNLYDITSREYYGWSRKSQQSILKSYLSTFEFECKQSIPLPHTASEVDLDVDGQFLLSGGSDGYFRIYEFTNPMDGTLSLVEQKQFVPSFITAIRWFPTDNGLFCIAYNEVVQFVDTNTLNPCETHTFPGQLFSCDWSSACSSLVALASSSSTVRFVDIRSGSSLSTLIISSQLQSKEHSATRVLWDKNDPDVIFVGDSSGHLHLYDIRNRRHPLQIAHVEDTIGQPVTNMTWTPDGMRLLTTHGVFNKTTMWTFKNKKLINSDVHFEVPLTRAPPKNKISPLIRCQIYTTDDFLFAPVPLGSRDIFMHSLTTGVLVKTFSSSEFGSSTTRRVNCVSGWGGESYPVIISGGRLHLRSWCTKIPEEKKEQKDQDNWSDSD